MQPSLPNKKRASLDRNLFVSSIAPLTRPVWWEYQLWRLRFDWRKNQLHAMSSVHKRAMPYISKNALSDWLEQSQKNREFFKSHELTDDKGTLKQAGQFKRGQQMLIDPAMDAVTSAADAGCFATYYPETRRRTHPPRIVHRAHSVSGRRETQRLRRNPGKNLRGVLYAFGRYFPHSHSVKKLDDH